MKWTDYKSQEFFCTKKGCEIFIHNLSYLLLLHSLLNSNIFLVSFLSFVAKQQISSIAMILVYIKVEYAPLNTVTLMSSH
jgi:hypothetical protein